MAIMAVAAIASAGAVAEGIIAVETLAAIATVTSVVGMVTDSKELKALGAGMGLGAMGAGLMGLGDAAAGAGAAAGAEGTSAAGGMATEAGSVAADGAANAANVTTFGVPDPMAGITDLSGGAAAGAAPAGAEAAMPIGDGGGAALGGNPMAGGDPSAMAATGPTQAAPDVTGVNAPGAPSGPAGPAGATAPTTPFDPAGTENAMPIGDGGGSGTFQSSGNYFGDTISKVGTWVDKNKTLASGMMNMAGGMMQGAAKAYEADRNYGLNKSLLDMKQQEMRNASAQPTINMRVNPNAAVFSNPPQQYAGIIAGARGGK